VCLLVSKAALLVAAGALLSLERRHLRPPLHCYSLLIAGRMRQTVGPQTRAPAVAGEVGEATTRAADGPTYPFGDDDGLPSAQRVSRPVNLDETVTHDADEQHVDLAVDVLDHTLVGIPDEQVHIQVRALIRPNRLPDGALLRQGDKIYHAHRVLVRIHRMAGYLIHGCLRDKGDEEAILDALDALYMDSQKKE
jgi:hypothetical protein